MSSAERKSSNVGKGLGSGMWRGWVIIGLGLLNLSLILGGRKLGGRSSSPSESKAKGSRGGWVSVVREAVRRLLRVPREGGGWGLGVVVGFGVGFEGGFFGGVGLGFGGVVGRCLPFGRGCLLVIERDRVRDAGALMLVGVGLRSFFSSLCRLENLVGRVASPLLFNGGGSSSNGIGFVRPDFRRPVSSRKEVGVWVVALFHGGDASIFRFLVGGFRSSGETGSGCFGSGVVWGRSPDSPGRFRVLLRIHGGLGGGKLEIEREGRGGG